MTTGIPVRAALAVFIVTTVCAAQEGLVAHYTFDSGKGTVVRDDSGNGNDGTIKGGATWVKAPGGAALEFNGRDGYVDCGVRDDLQSLSSAFTVTAWIRPKVNFQGGVVGWVSGRGWSDQRLVLAVNTWHGGNDLGAWFGDGVTGRWAGGKYGIVRPGAWTHVAVTFDGTTGRTYRDGSLRDAREVITKIALKDVPLWIGRSMGLGIDAEHEHFRGLVDDVRMYARALSADEMMARYKADAGARGRDTALFNRPVLDVHAFPMPGKIMVRIDARAMRPFAEGMRFRVSLCKTGSQAPIRREIVPLDRATGTARAVLEAGDLGPADLAMRVTAVGADLDPIGEEAVEPLPWPERPAAFKGVKVLNNLCWELLSDPNGTAKPRKYTFTQPVTRWVFIRSIARVGEAGNVRIALDPRAAPSPLILHDQPGVTAREAMRFLEAGTYTLRVTLTGDAALEELLVRSIPALQHYAAGANPVIKPYGPYDWAFLEKDVLPNVNTMISYPHWRDSAELKEWKAAGRRWICHANKPRYKEIEGKPTYEQVYDQWRKSPGYDSALMDGIIIDEFSSGPYRYFDPALGAADKLGAEFPDRPMYVFWASNHRPAERSDKFVRTLLRYGGYVCLEKYLGERASERAADDVMRTTLIDDILNWRTHHPGIVPHVVMVLGYMSLFPESNSIYPDVNFRVHMGREYAVIATHPAFFGLGGVQWYNSSWADEENVRWAGYLNRHYALEGRTSRLSNDPYRLAHIRNPDFADGTRGWTVRPAEPGRIRTASHSGFSYLQGRYPLTRVGDRFLVMKRRAKAPNIVTQQITGLQPGRLYSLKMVTADYGDLLKGKSAETKNAVSVAIDPAERLTGPKKSFQFTFYSIHPVGAFDRKNRLYMNYHW